MVDALGAKAKSIAERVRSGDVRAAARLMRLVDDEAPLGRAAYGELYRVMPEARVIGITGSAGAGKSTLVNALISCLRARAERVGVVAVDPSSPLTGGALLADRARMQMHALDSDVFIRSLASRGQHGGLSASASALVGIVEGMGFDSVLLETVGIGQGELDVRSVADTVVVVLVPGMGDDLQAMKAGLMEIGDVYVLNKADREGADEAQRQIEAEIHLRPSYASDVWAPRVVKTCASSGDGIPALLEEMDRHRQHLVRTGELAKRRLARARLELETALERHMRRELIQRAGGEDALDRGARRLTERVTDPFAECAKLFDESAVGQGDT